MRPATQAIRIKPECRPLGQFRRDGDIRACACRRHGLLEFTCYADNTPSPTRNGAQCRMRSCNSCSRWHHGHASPH